jgi:hypothetical protein
LRRYGGGRGVGYMIFAQVSVCLCIYFIFVYTAFLLPRLMPDDGLEMVGFL